MLKKSILVALSPFLSSWPNPMSVNRGINNFPRFRLDAAEVIATTLLHKSPNAADKSVHGSEIGAPLVDAARNCSRTENVPFESRSAELQRWPVCRPSIGPIGT